jgi:protein O-mannosyl-transferase
MMRLFLPCQFIFLTLPFQKPMRMGEEVLNVPAKKGKEKKALPIRPPSLGGMIHSDGLPIALIVGLAVLLYSPTLNYPFHFDDFSNIVENPYIRRLGDFSLLIKGLTLHQSWFRALPTFTFALNYHFHQLEVFGYHLVNLILHICSGILIYFISKHLLQLKLQREGGAAQDRTGRFPSYPTPLFSLFIALIFIVHPIQVNTVTYIVQRNEGLSSFFFLLSFFLFIKGFGTQGLVKVSYFIGVGIALLGSVFSKEIGFTLPILLILFDLIFICRDRETAVRHLKIYGWGFLPIALYLLFFLRGGILILLLKGSGDFFWSPVENLMTQANVILQYIKLMVFPWPGWLNVDHDFQVSKTLFEFPTLLSVSAILSLLVFAILSVKKRRLPSFAIGWFFIILAPTSSLIPLWDVMVEYRLYLPMFSYGLLLALMFHGLYRFLSRHYSIKIGQAVVFGTMIFMICVYSIFTLQRNDVFKDGVRLWEDAKKKSPLKARVYNNLGVLLRMNNRLEEAKETLQEALKKNPKNLPAVHYSLGRVYSQMGDDEAAISHFEKYLREDPEDIQALCETGSIYLRMGLMDKADAYFQRVLATRPDFAPVHSGLGDLYVRKGMFQEAIDEYRKALRIDPGSSKVRLQLAEAYSKKGRVEEALVELKGVIAAHPEQPEAYLSLGAVYLRIGRLEEAFRNLEKALSMDSRNAEIYNNLGVGYRKKGQIDEAIAHYRKAIEIDPKRPDAYLNLGEAYWVKGRTEEALAAYQKAISMSPYLPEPHNNLGVLYLEKKRFDEAIPHFKQALALNPGYGEAYFNLAVAYYYKRDYRRALDQLTRAMDLGYQGDPRLLELLRSGR